MPRNDPFPLRRALNIAALACLALGDSLPAQSSTTTILLDSFDSVSHWTTNSSAGVEATIHSDSNGLHGRALRLDFDFQGRRGYTIVRRALDLRLPPKYAFSFAIRGNAPTNTLEFKLVDSAAASVWWSNNPRFEFPPFWTPVVRTQEQISFAWGQARNRRVTRLAAIEFAVTAGSGGKGTIWIDDLAFMPVSVPALGSVALSILLLAAGAAFTRAPVLRRRLLALGSARYTESPMTSWGKGLMDAMNSVSNSLGGGQAARDSLVVWGLTLGSAVITIGLLKAMWPQLPGETWSVGLIALGVGAFALSRRSQPDPEIAHVTLTAAVFWILLGAGWLAPTPENLAVCALIAALVIHSVKRPLAGPRSFAKLAIGFALWSVAAHELSFTDAEAGTLHLRWIISGVVTLGAGGLIVRQLIAETGEEIHAIIAAAATYFTALVLIWSALDPVWPPLVTTSYAVLGALLLILSRREGTHPLLKFLGSATMVIVAARLLLVDLSRVEAIWRVLLFILCGALFLYTAYRMRGPRSQ